LLATARNDVWSGSDATTGSGAGPSTDRPPTGLRAGPRWAVRSHSVHPELVTIAAVVKIPQFPDWQQPGLWEIIHKSRLLCREDFYNQCDSGILSAGRHLIDPLKPGYVCRLSYASVGYRS